MNPDSDILSAHLRLTEAIAAFNALWRAAPHHAQTYELPLYDGGVVPDRIPIDLALGERASVAAAEGLARFARAPDQAPTTSWRLPGVVFCVEDLVRELATVNAVKDELRELVKRAAPADVERRALVRRLFPGQSVLQIYRHVHVASREVVRIAFTWSPTTASSSTMSVEEAGALVEERLGSGEITDPGQRRSFEIAWRDLGKLDHGRNRIVRRKVVAPHPRVTLFEGVGRGAPKRMHHANLPVFVFGRDRLPLVPLKDFDVANRRRTRSDLKPLLGLLNGLQLFVDRR